MAVGLATILWLLLGVVAALVMLLFVPADYAFSAGTRAGLRLRARWLFGLVRVDRTWPVQGVAREKLRERRDGRSRGAARLVRRMLAIEGLEVGFMRLVTELVRSLGWRRGRIVARVGLGDPAATGELCGWVGPALAVVPSWTPLQVEFQPDFADDVVDARAEGSGRFVPARAVAAIGRFALSRAGRRFLGVMLWRRGR
jgi:hypothetical protein